jgi:hypothetical protein
MSQVPYNRLTNIEPENSGLKNVYKVGGATSLILGVLFLTTAICFAISIIWTEGNKGWFSLLQSNWLIVIFKLHAGLINIQDNPLHGLNLLDIVILVMFSLLCFGLFTALKKDSKIWSLIAFALSLVTIILFFVTQIAGRSTVMLSVMIFSIVMRKGKIFNKVIIYAGIFAGVFLFVGDLSVGIQSIIITTLFGIGYVLITAWFFMIGRKLFWLGVTNRKVQTL